MDYLVNNGLKSNQIILNGKSYKVENILIFILFYYTFCYTVIIRLILGEITHLNLMYSIVPCLVIVLYYLVFTKFINLFVLYLVIFIFSINIVSIVYFNIPFSGVYRFIVSLLIPLLVVGIKLQESKMIFKRFIKIYNWIIIINIFYGLIDYVLHKKLQFLLADFLLFSSISRSIQADLNTDVYRLFSLLGHPLTNTLLLIIFIGINLLYQHYYKDNINFNTAIIFLTTIVGSFLCNSKFGILIILLILLSAILTGSNKGKKLLYILICCIIVLLNSSLRNNVLNRFFMAFEEGDVSNGRFSAIGSLIQNDVSLPFFFLGKGIGASDYLLQSISDLDNIEVPAVMFMYDYGIFITILIYIILYLIPVVIFVKNKHWYMLFLYTMIFLFANSYNGLATSMGIVQILTFFSMFLINLSKDLRRKEHYKMQDPK